MNMKNQTWKAIVSAAAVCAAAASPLLADTNTWTGVANANVLNANNWLNVAGEFVLPGTADTARIGDAPEADLSNGSATYAHLWLGTEAGKTGAMTVGSGGTLKLTDKSNGALRMGNVDGSAGVLTIEGGDVTIESLNTPNFAATSTVNLVSGTLTINDWVDWGRNAKGLATFNQSGGTLDLKQGFQIGPGNSGTGIYNMSGGVVNGCVNDHFRVGWKSKGVFNLTGGTLNLPSNNKKYFYVGHDNGSNGTFTQDGGIVTEKDLRVGDVSGAVGLYTLNAGTNRTSTGWVQIGCAGRGKFVQNGGELQISSNMRLWLADAATGDGTYVMNGGLCTVGGMVGVGSKGKGFFMMNGGTFETPKIESGSDASGNGRVLLNGGTLKAAAAGALFAIGNASSVNDWTIGRDFTIDTNGKDVSSGIASFKATSGSSLTKTGEGTLTMAALPRADSITVAKGTLSLSSDADNTPSVDLVHRWNFNGNLNDSAGGAPAKIVGSVAYTDDGKSVRLAGGNNGASYVNLGKGLLAGDDLTLEFWAERISVKKWARVFECGTGQNNYVMASWVRNNNGAQSKLAVKYGVDEKNQTDKMEFTDDERIHFAVRYRKNANGTTTITWVKRNPDTGAVVKTSDFKPTGLDEGWSLEKVAEGNFNLGHSDVWTDDNDANAIYDEVRIWRGALSDDALTLSAQKGPDATTEDIAAIVAKNDETATVERTLEIAPGATLAIGDGNTLTQPVLDAGGTLASGTLAVTKGLVVTPGQTMTVADGATLDLSAVTEVALKDPSAPVPTGSWVVATSPSGGIASGTREIKLTGALSGYSLFITPTHAKIGRHGLVIIFY